VRHACIPRSHCLFDSDSSCGSGDEGLARECSASFISTLMYSDDRFTAATPARRCRHRLCHTSGWLCCVGVGGDAAVTLGDDFALALGDDVALALGDGGALTAGTDAALALGTQGWLGDAFDSAAGADFALAWCDAEPASPPKAGRRRRLAAAEC
jgi:hypothetical protein